MEHISFQTLLDYLANDLNAAVRSTVEAHLATCVACQSELDRGRRFLASVRGPGLEAPPPSSLQRLRVAFRRRLRQPAQRSRVAASLQFDNRAKLTSPGVRGAAQEHLLLYAAGPFDVDVQILRDDIDNAWRLRGQILSNESQPAELEATKLRLTIDGDGERLGLTDELGRFSFSHLAQGTYSLQLIFDQYEFVLEPLIIGG